MFKQIINIIKKYETIVIARHIGPDPDALASQIALREIIKLNFPNKKVYSIGKSVSKFKFMGELDKIKDVEKDTSLLIMLDVPRFDRIDGTSYEDYSYTLKIDHHPCENGICDFEYIDETSSSTCQILAEMVYELKLKINREIASNLLVGIITDSDRFLLSYTTPKTLELSSKLLKDYNFSLKELYTNIYERDINERRFEAYIINNLIITNNGFGYIKITSDIIKKYNVDSSTASNLVNNLNYIKGLKVWAFSSYDESLKLFKINIRSKEIEINEIARKYNGGGHKFASGARIESENDVDKLFYELDNACKEQ